MANEISAQEMIKQAQMHLRSVLLPVFVQQLANRNYPIYNESQLHNAEKIAAYLAATSQQSIPASNDIFSQVANHLEKQAGPSSYAASERQLIDLCEKAAAEAIVNDKNLINSAAIVASALRNQ